MKMLRAVLIPLLLCPAASAEPVSTSAATPAGVELPNPAQPPAPAPASASPEGRDALAEILDEPDPGRLCTRLILHVGDRVLAHLEAGRRDLRRALTPGEWKVSLYSALLVTADKFLADLFCQELDLEGSRALAGFLAELGLKAEAELLAEALALQTRGRRALTEEEFQSLRCEELEAKEEARFTEIAHHFRQPECGIWGDPAGERIARWARANRDQFR